MLTASAFAWLCSHFCSLQKCRNLIVLLVANRNMYKFKWKPIKKQNKSQQSQAQVAVLILKRVIFSFSHNDSCIFLYLIPLFHNFSDPFRPNLSSTIHDKLPICQCNQLHRQINVASTTALASMIAPCLSDQMFKSTLAASHFYWMHFCASDSTFFNFVITASSKNFFQPLCDNRTSGNTGNWLRNFR